MHVLILNQTFYPDVAATAQHMWDLARHLVGRGHRVTAIASRTLYGTEKQAGPAYERVGGVEVHRLGGTSFGKRGLGGRLADFASFYAAAAVRLHRVAAPDVVLALTTPPMIAALGMMRKQSGFGGAGRRTRFVYHVMDLYPDAAVASGVMRERNPLNRSLEHLTGRTLEQADAVIALGRDMRDRLLTRYRSWVRPERIHVIPPWADGRELHPLEKPVNPLAAALGLCETFNVVYSGNLGIAHDVQTMVDAIGRTAGDPLLRWVFIGGGKRLEQLRAHAAGARWPHVQFLPYQDRDALNPSLNLADVHLVSQLPPFTGVVVPSKLFGIMAVGRPAIMVGPAEAECSRILSENNAGFVVNNGDAQGLLGSIDALRSDAQLRLEMGRRARQAFEERYDRSIACGRITSLLERL